MAAVRCLLCVACCVLFSYCRWSLVVGGCLLHVVRWLMFVVVVRCVLFAVCCSLYDVCCLLSVVCGLLFVVC